MIKRVKCQGINMKEILKKVDSTEGYNVGKARVDMGIEVCIRVRMVYIGIREVQ